MPNKPASPMLTMEDPKELTQLDALFRHAFEDLPDTPSDSGWDVPSPNVWKGIQAHLSGAFHGRVRRLYSSVAIAGLLATAILIGIYLAFQSRTEISDANTQVNRPLDPSSGHEYSAEAPSSILTSPPANPTQPQAARRSAGAPKRENSQQPLSSLPLPGSVPAPNTTIRRQVEELRLAPWAQPLSPLPQRFLPPSDEPPVIRELLPFRQQ